MKQTTKEKKQRPYKLSCWVETIEFVRRHFLVCSLSWAKG